MVGKKKELAVNGEPVPAENLIKEKTKKKKNKKNKHAEEGAEEPTNVSDRELDDCEELSKKEKKKRKREKEKKEKEAKKKKEEEENGFAGEVPEKKPKAENSGVSSGDEEEDKKVVVTGKDAEEAKYAALTSFAASNLPENVLQCCKNFQRPSPIQAHSWPFLLNGRDVIGIAKTGSG